MPSVVPRMIRSSLPGRQEFNGCTRASQGHMIGQRDHAKPAKSFRHVTRPSSAENERSTIYAEKKVRILIPLVPFLPFVCAFRREGDELLERKEIVRPKD